MHFEGVVEIDATRDRVWAFLMDPERVGRCGPGVETIQIIDDAHFKAVAKVGVGYVSARFSVNIDVAEQEPPSRAVLRAHGQAPGSAVDGTAEMRLTDLEDGRTLMEWTSEVNLSGTLASVGARLIQGTANKMIMQTFACIRSRLEAETATAVQPQP